MKSNYLASILRQKFLASSLMVFAFVASGEAAQKQSFADYKGSYTGTWSLLAQGSGGTLTSTPGTASINISSARKGKSGTVTIAMGSVIADATTFPPGTQRFAFSGKSLAIQEVLPVVAPGFPINGTFSAKKNSINGHASAVIASSGVNVSVKLTHRSSKKRQIVKLVYIAIITSSGSTAVYTYTFEGSGKLKK